MDRRNARVVKGLGGLYEVLLENGERLTLRAKGVFRHEDKRLQIGDIVEIEEGEGSDNLVISEICERKKSLIRPPLANLDMLFVVAAAASPAPVLSTLDKLIAIAEHNKIEVALIFSKSDLSPTEAYEKIYKDAGYTVFSISNETKDGIGELKAYIEKRLTNGVCAAFAGASGVGKSTLLNSLFPELSLETGDISKKIERGKHTTRHVEIFEVNKKEENGRVTSGFLADTPGFSLLDFVRFDFFTLDDLLPCFKEFVPYSLECKYTDCTHVKEAECEIVRAVARGELSKSRHECYCELYEILKKKKSYNFKKTIDK
ncbi:MAG: ribosome small subunit-dependent GTPase A [Clostridia bacterium]|nr:ribosome small subunit-dependent GTPase A [Clostridia bacterium]